MFGSIIHTYIFQIRKICLISHRSNNSRRSALIFLPHSCYNLKFPSRDIINKHMLCTKKNLIFRYSLDVDWKTIYTRLSIHFLVHKYKRMLLSCMLIKEIKPFIKGGKQQLVRAIFDNGNNFFILSERVMFKGGCYSIKTIDATTICSYPNNPIAILKKTIYCLITQAMQITEWYIFIRSGIYIFNTNQTISYTSCPHIIYRIYIQTINRISRKWMNIPLSLLYVREWKIIQINHIDSTTVSRHPKLVISFCDIMNYIIRQRRIECRKMFEQLLILITIQTITICAKP